MLKSRVPEVRILQGRRFIDLSHPLVHGMPGFRMAAPDGESIEYSISVRPFLTHEESRKFYHGQCSFEVTEVKMQTSVGTYLDAPRHRYQEGKDVSAFALEDLVMRGIVVDARGLNAFDALDTKALPGMHFMAGRAVLFCFGWDSKWGTDEYRRYPHLSSSCLQVLLSSGAKLIGVDTPNVDDASNLKRPAHTELLGRGVLILENLASLAELVGHEFVLFAVPLSVKDAASMPVRAFAEVFE